MENALQIVYKKNALQIFTCTKYALHKLNMVDENPDEEYKYSNYSYDVILQPV